MEELKPINVTIVGVLDDPFNINVYQSQLDEMENTTSIVELQVRKHLRDRGFEIPERNLLFANYSSRTKFLQQHIIDNNHYFDVPENQLSYYYVSQVRYDMGDYFNETWYCGAYFNDELAEEKPMLWNYIPLPFRCEYEFYDKHDLLDVKCLSNNLTERMVIDILNNLQHEDYYQLDDDVKTVWINGEYSNGQIIIQYSFENSSGDYVESFFNL